MELLSLPGTQLIFPAVAVAIVLLCAALVFTFGFHSAEQPQFDKLPLVVDDKKSSSKKKKIKDKKSSPNRVATEDAKTKSETSKKSPSKEKAKEAEKPKPKEKPVEPKVVKKEATTEPKKGKKNKVTEADKPVDFDDGLWEEVPKKEKKVEKKKVVKTPEEKKESPKKESPRNESPAKSPGKKPTKLKAEETNGDVVAVRKVQVPVEPVEENVISISMDALKEDGDAARKLQAQVEEFQRVLKEAERRQQVALGQVNDAEDEGLTEVKDLRSTKRNEIIEKQKKKASEAVSAKNLPKQEVEEKVAEVKQDENNTPVFDELGDSWTDAKAPKKGKKKARKDQ